MTEKRIFLDSSQNIYGMTEISQVEKNPHSHYMKHIIISLEDKMHCVVKERKLYGCGFAIQSEVPHAIRSQTPVLLISIPELSVIGKSMNTYIFQGEDYYIFPDEIVENIREYWTSDFSQEDLIPTLFGLLQIPIYEPLLLDSRIQKVMQLLAGCECENYSLKYLSEAVGLSEGRLSRLFHQETGITLKNYLLLLKLSHTFSNMQKGKNLTTSCIEAGFSSSAHFAYALHKWFGFTGRQLKSYLDHADFL